MKYCSKCGKELLDEAVICPGCGCYVEEKQLVQQDYKAILRKTKVFFVIGVVLLVFGAFSWVATSSLALVYTVIGEQIQANVLGMRPTLSMYHACNSLATWSSVVFFLAAEIAFIIPRERFNAAFKRENHELLIKDKTEYKKAAKEKNREMNNEIPCYKASWLLAIAACVLFVISVFIPSLGL